MENEPSEITFKAVFIAHNPSFCIYSDHVSRSLTRGPKEHALLVQMRTATQMYGIKLYFEVVEPMLA